MPAMSVGLILLIPLSYTLSHQKGHTRRTEQYIGSGEQRGRRDDSDYTVACGPGEWINYCGGPRHTKAHLDEVINASPIVTNRLRGSISAPLARQIDYFGRLGYNHVDGTDVPLDEILKALEGSSRTVKYVPSASQTRHPMYRDVP